MFESPFRIRVVAEPQPLLRGKPSDARREQTYDLALSEPELIKRGVAATGRLPTPVITEGTLWHRIRTHEANLHSVGLRRLARDQLRQGEWQHCGQRAGQDEVQGALQVRPSPARSTTSSQRGSWRILRGSGEG